VLKQIDKMKHLAEKKRLLYVALTRAEHDVVISALLKEKKPDKEGHADISLREDSYLFMVTDALGIEAEALYRQRHSDCITIEVNKKKASAKVPVSYMEHSFKEIVFKKKGSVSATQSEGEPSVDAKAAQRGTMIHKIIELHWQTFQEKRDAILDKMGLFDAYERDAVCSSMEKFYQSTEYICLSKGAEHRFELPFHVDGKSGFIDLIYFDEAKNGWVIVDFKTGTSTVEKEKKYQAQLDFYKDVMEAQGERVVQTRLLWL